MEKWVADVWFEGKLKLTLTFEDHGCEPASTVIRRIHEIVESMFPMNNQVFVYQPED